jgi:RNA polymerase sigma-70 factor (ECF subfamily)
LRSPQWQLPFSQPQEQLFEHPFVFVLLFMIPPFKHADGCASKTLQSSARLGGMALSSNVVEQLVNSHREFLAFVQKRVESREVAEDILQAAFVKGLERAPELRSEESAVAWFYRLLRNAVIDHYRHRGSTQRAYEAWGKEFESSEAASQELENEICKCLNGLMTTLKPEYREALQTIDVNDGSLNDLAAKTGITAGNAAVRVHRAREAFRKQVLTACGTCAEHGCLDCHCAPPRK